ncbi:MAG: hypothetical protein AABX89_07665 [Candidatus Thermoplasmatota archaeon]
MQSAPQSSPAADGPRFHFKEAYLADWVLPNEAAPFHLLWTPFDALNAVEFRLPTGVEIKAIHNARLTSMDEHTTGTTFRVTDVGIHGYLSGTLLCKRLPVAREEIINIQAAFFSGEQEIHVVDVQTRVIRPTIEIVDAPDNFRIPPDGKAGPLEIKVKLVGSGSARVHVEVTSNGQSKIRNELLFEAILKRLAPRRDLDEPLPASEPPKGTRVKVGEELVVETMSRILNALDTGEKLDPEFLAAMRAQREMLGDKEYREKLGRLLHSEIEQIWIASLLDMMSMNPAEGVRMQQGNTSIVLDHHFQSLDFALTYQDSMGNDYPVLNHHISVNDERTNGKSFEIPVRIVWLKEKMEAKK